MQGTASTAPALGYRASSDQSDLSIEVTLFLFEDFSIIGTNFNGDVFPLAILEAIIKV